FKIRYTGRSLPQPVLAWAAAPDEFRAAFDRPLEPDDWAKAKEQVKIEAGVHVRAGDRFEILRPGYQVVRDQMATPRRWVEVLDLTLSEDRRALVLRVARQTEAVNYAVTLPTPDAWKQRGGIAQHPQIDLLVTLNGLAASVTTSDGQERRSVLPHSSLAVSGALTAGSAEHEAFLNSAAARNATLTLRGSVDASNPFVPAVQPGSKLDWDMAADPFASAIFGVRSDYSGETREVRVDTVATSPLRTLKPLPATNPAPTANGLFLAWNNLHHAISTSRFYLP